jgi:hypothetical protein
MIPPHNTQVDKIKEDMVMVDKAITGPINAEWSCSGHWWLGIFQEKGKARRYSYYYECCDFGDSCGQNEYQSYSSLEELFQDNNHIKPDEPGWKRCTPFPDTPNQ